jgi:hypothetical protein
LKQYLDRPSFVRSRVEEIIARAEAGELRAAARSDTGNMVAMPAKMWNTEMAAQFIAECKVTIHGPLSTIVKNGPVYMKTQSLEQFLLRQPFAEVTQAALPHLSPYLKLMLSVARKLDVSRTNQPKKAAIVAELNAACEGGPLSERMVEMMATLLREPDSQRGRGASRKPPPK